MLFAWLSASDGKKNRPLLDFSKTWECTCLQVFGGWWESRPCSLSHVGPLSGISCVCWERLGNHIWFLVRIDPLSGVSLDVLRKMLGKQISSFFRMESISDVSLKMSREMPGKHVLSSFQMGPLAGVSVDLSR